MVPAWRRMGDRQQGGWAGRSSRVHEHTLQDTGKYGPRVDSTLFISKKSEVLIDCPLEFAAHSIRSRQSRETPDMIHCDPAASRLGSAHIVICSKTVPRREESRNYAL